MFTIYFDAEEVGLIDVIQDFLKLTFRDTEITDTGVLINTKSVRLAHIVTDMRDMLRKGDTRPSVLNEVMSLRPKVEWKENDCD